MEDKEREFYYNWIQQLMQFNMQLVTNMMQMSMANFQRMIPTPPIPPMSISSLMPSQESLEKMLKSMGNMGMFGPNDDDDKEKLK